MPVATRPKLGKLSTPVSSTFPSEITSANTATPLSAVSMYIKQEPCDYIKTPISPPVAYTDFLTKAMLLNSPNPAAAATAAASGEVISDSAPSTGNSLQSEASKESRLSRTSSATSTSTNNDKPSPPATAACVPPSPFTSVAPPPMSAPPTGAAAFPSFRLPPSPAVSHLDSPRSARSPFSAKSVNSVFDWDAALKARFAEQRKQKSSRTSVRHIREVVTRTVTYTPKMEPAPKGKRRKIE